MSNDINNHRRRTFLKLAGATGTAGIAGLAGCTGGDGGDGGDGGSDGGDGGGGGDGGDGGGGGDGGDGGGGQTTTTSQAETEPFKLGVLEPLSGPISPTGVTALEGMQLVLDDVNERGGLAGRQVELLTTDTEASPDTAVKRARQFVTQENVDMLAGVVSSAVAKTINQFAAQQGVVFVCVNAQTPDITGSECSKTTFRTSTNLIHIQKALARGVAQLTPDDATTIAGVNPDYVYGHQSWEVFQQEFKQLRPDMEVVSETFPAFLKGDYKKEIQATLGADADIVHSVLYAGDMISFMKQAKQFDFFDEVPNFVFAETMDVLYAFGNDFPDGNLIAELFVAGPGWPTNDVHDQFTQAHIDELDKEPTSNAYAGASFVHALEAAVETAGGTSTEDLISGFEGLSFESPQSPDTLIRADDHQGLLEGQLVDVVEPLDDKDRYGFKEPFNTVPRADFQDDVTCQF